MEKEKHKIEDYEPGATKRQVFNALHTVVKSPVKAKKKPQKPVAPPQQA